MRKQSIRIFNEKNVRLDLILIMRKGIDWILKSICLFSITIKCTASFVMYAYIIGDIIWCKMSNLESVLFLAGTYIPRKEVAVLEVIKATVIRENQAIRLRARKEGLDRSGVQRVTGL